MLRTGGRRPHEVSGKASNTCPESHLARPSNPYQHTFRLDFEMASKEDDEAFIAKGRQLSGVLPMALIFELAEALLNERSLECERITEIGARHLPGSAHEWKCP
jgi:hypothetical protein